MALISCPECGKQISEQASVCPNCGFKVSKYRTKKICKNSIDKLKEKRIHISKQSFKDLFNINNILDKIDDLPVVGRFLYKALFVLFGLIIGLLFIVLSFAVIFCICWLIGFNWFLGCTVLTIVWFAIDYWLNSRIKTSSVIIIIVLWIFFKFLTGAN